MSPGEGSNLLKSRRPLMSRTPRRLYAKDLHERDITEYTQRRSGYTQTQRIKIIKRVEEERGEFACAEISGLSCPIIDGQRGHHGHPSGETLKKISWLGGVRGVNQRTLPGDFFYNFSFRGGHGGHGGHGQPSSGFSL